MLCGVGGGGVTSDYFREIETYFQSTNETPKCFRAAQKTGFHNFYVF